MRSARALVTAAALAVACGRGESGAGGSEGPPPDPTSTDGTGTGGTGGTGDTAGTGGPTGTGAPTGTGGAGGTGTAGTGGPTGPGPAPAAPPSDGRSLLQLEIERGGTSDRASHVDVDVKGIALFLDGVPAPPVHGAACDATGAEWHDQRTALRLAMGQPGASPLARLETTRSGELSEIRIFLRGDVQRLGRAHNLDGAETCVWADGWDVAVLLLRPAARLVLAGGQDHRLAAPLGVGSEVRVERIVCDLPGVGRVAGGSVASATSALHDADGPDECKKPEDPEDDGDSRTRLRFVLAAELGVQRRDPT
jgi:hypothetical protein